MAESLPEILFGIAWLVVVGPALFAIAQALAGRAPNEDRKARSVEDRSRGQGGEPW